MQSSFLDPAVLRYAGPASHTDTRLFLSVDTPETIALMYELWNGYSGAPGLLDAGPGKKYLYDPARHVYRNTATGSEVRAVQLIRYVRNVSYEAGVRMKKSTQQLIAGTIMLSIWYGRMRNLMRALYKTIWILGIGGFVFDDDTQRNLFYLFTLLQFNYFDNFTEQVYSGIQPLDGRAMSRAGMYGSYGNALHQNMDLVEAEPRGYSEAKRILGDNENHCVAGERPGCIDLALQGWIPVRAMLPIGSAQCFSMCHCRIIYR